MHCQGSKLVNGDTCPRPTTGEVCDIECGEGYELEGSFVCQADGSFRGGACGPSLCTRNTVIQHSDAVCNKRTSEVCHVECHPGFSVHGAIVCQPDGVMRGGECQADQCTGGTMVDHSRTACGGAPQAGGPRGFLTPLAASPDRPSGIVAPGFRRELLYL